MAEAIRDVLIRVSVENGNLKLPAFDPSAAESSVQQVQRDLESVVGSFSISATDAVKNFELALSEAAKHSQTSFAKIRQPQGKREKEGQERLDKTIPPDVRRTSREKNKNKPNETPPSKKASGTDSSGAADSAFRLAKGIAAVGATTQADSESMLKAIDAAQSYYDVAVGLTKAIEGISSARTAATAATAAGTAATAEAATATAAGTAATTGGTAVMAGMTAAAVVLAAAVVVVVGAFALWRLSVMQEMDRVNSKFQVGIDITQSYAASVAKMGQIQSSGVFQMVNMNRGIQKRGEMIPKEISSARGTELQNRSFEEDANRTAGQKDVHRKLSESRLGYQTKRDTLNNQESVLRDSIARLSKGKEDEQKNAKKAWSARIVAQGAIQAKQRYMESNPDRESLGRSPEQKIGIAKLNEDVAANMATGYSEQAASAGRVTQFASEQLKKEGELLEVLKAKNDAAREYEQVAYDVAKAVKEQVKSHETSVGSMDFGDQNMHKRIQDKFDANEKIRKENIAAGREETEGFLEYTQFEIQATPESFAASEGTQEQARRQGKKSGIRGRYDLDPDDAEAILKSREGEANEVASSTGESIKTESAKLPEIAKNLAEAIQSTMDLGSWTEEVLRKLDDIKANNRDYKMKVQQHPV